VRYGLGYRKRMVHTVYWKVNSANRNIKTTSVWMLHMLQ
jgi:hypothetical protein